MRGFQGLICSHLGHRWEPHQGNSTKRRCGRCGRVDWLFEKPYPVAGEPKYLWKEKTMTEVEEIKMFGCTIGQLREAVEPKHVSARMFAMSILSDTQELLPHNATDSERIKYSLEMTRQHLNRAKWVISNYLVSKPSPEEEAALNHAIAHDSDMITEAGEERRQHLRWLLDPRR